MTDVIDSDSHAPSKKRGAVAMDGSAAHDDTVQASKPEMSFDESIRAAIKLGLRFYGEKIKARRPNVKSPAAKSEKPENPVDYGHKKTDQNAHAMSKTENSPNQTQPQKRQKLEKSSQTVYALCHGSDIEYSPIHGNTPRQILGINSKPPSYLLQNANETEPKVGSKSTIEEDWNVVDRDSTVNALYAHTQLNFNKYAPVDLDQNMKNIYCNLSYLVQSLQPKGWKWPEKTRFEFLSRCNFREFSKSIYTMQGRFRLEQKEQTAQLAHLRKVASEFLQQEKGGSSTSDPIKALEEHVRLKQQALGRK